MLGQMMDRSKLTIGCVISAVFYSSFLLYGLFEQHSGTLLAFKDRAISQATIEAVDVNARIQLYYKAIAVGLVGTAGFLLCFLGGLVLLQKWANNDARHDFDFEAKVFHVFSLFGIITAASGLMGIEWKPTFQFVLSFQSLIVLLAICKGIALRFKMKEASAFLHDRTFIIWQFVFSFSLMLYLEYLFKPVEKTLIGSDAYYYILSFAVLLITSLSFLIVWKRKSKQTENDIITRFVTGIFPIFLTPSLMPLSNEIYLIFNQNGIFHITPSFLLWVLFVLSLGISVFIFYRMSRRPSSSALTAFDFLRNRYYPALLMILVSILYQPYVHNGPPGEWFESGNGGLGVDQFFRYGKIPLLETFNAHAVSELFAPVLFSLFNGYQQSAGFLYQGLTDAILYFLIAFFFMKRLISAEYVLLILVLLPIGFTKLIIPEYFSFALIVVFVLHRLIDKPNFKNYLVFCLVLSFTFLWRFDIGFAAIVSGFLVYFLYLFLYRGTRNLRSFAIAGGVIAVFWLFLFTLLSLVKGVPFGSRLKEMLAVMSSNQIWGYAGIGDPQSFKYYIFYFLVPAANIGMLVFVLFKTKFHERINPVIFISILYPLLFTMLNFTRGLVRHSLVENAIGVILGLLAFPILYLPYLLWQRRSNFVNFSKFAILSLCYCMVFMYLSGNKPFENSLVGTTMQRFAGFENYPSWNEKVPRYVEPEQYAAENYNALMNFFDNTMAPHETFIDFSNTPYLYAITKRETPMFVNQTPIFLSDDKSQMYYLAEIRKHSIPYAVFPDSKGIKGFDGLDNSTRSYRVAEYLFSHYSPLVRINGFNIWVSNDRKRSAEDSIASLQASKPEEIPIYDPEVNNDPSFIVNDLSYQMDKEGIVMTAGDNDPQLAGVLSAHPQEWKVDGGNGDELNLQYNSQIGGKLQVFYRINEEPFSEKNSVFVDVVSQSGNNIVTIPIPSSGLLNDIRFDPPAGDRFVMQALTLSIHSPNQLSPVNFSPVEASDIAWLPYLWGERDPLQAIDNTKVLIDALVSSLDEQTFAIQGDIDKSSGNYIYLSIRATSPADPFKVRLGYGVKDASGKKKAAGEIAFNVIADGEFHDYLVRISSQYNWYRTPVSYIDLRTDLPIDLKQLNIRRGD